ncbi:MAG: J domain-containing protein [Alphaproteobacteria bacterium]|nr:J domain-containing protein [Alphaproteobacteria bacterium]
MSIANGTIKKKCDHPSCEAEGDFPAPKSRIDLRDYYWFCLDHIRTYNKSWDYYKNMSAEEIETYIRFDTVWQRPSWRLGHNIGQIHDSLNILGWKTKNKAQSAPQTEEEKALATLSLTPPATWTDIKNNYKMLVKNLHPDINGGNKIAEEKLKNINRAYSFLRKKFA